MATFWASEIEQVTGGWVDIRMLQNWRQQEAWITSWGPNEITAVYPYRREHVIEAALVAELNRIGLDQKLAREIIWRRIVDHLTSNAECDPKKVRRREVLEIDIRSGLGALPEFFGPPRRPDRRRQERSYVWTVVVRTMNRGSNQREIDVHLVERKNDLPHVMADCGANGPVIIIDVTQIRDRVEATLKARLS